MLPQDLTKLNTADLYNSQELVQGKHLLQIKIHKTECIITILDVFQNPLIIIKILYSKNNSYSQGHCPSNSDNNLKPFQRSVRWLYSDLKVMTLIN